MFSINNCDLPILAIISSYINNKYLKLLSQVLERAWDLKLDLGQNPNTGLTPWETYLFHLQSEDNQAYGIQFKSKLNETNYKITLSSRVPGNKFFPFLYAFL